MAWLPSAALALGAATAAAAPAARVPKVIATYPHDEQAFTQGLLLHDGRLYESAGQYGESNVRRVVPATGEVEARVDLDAAHFGEGLARVPGSAGDRLVQLTWRAGTALVWNLADLSAAGTFTYSGEGWGLCYDSVGQRLVMSDGSSRLTFRDPQTFATTGDIGVTRDGSPLSRLNELECVGGHVWSNVWLTDDIVEIDPNSGVVLTVVDAASLRPAANAGDDDVLNGIAYDATTGHYLVTGKRWPKLFEVEWVAGDEPGTTPRSGAGRPNLGCGAALPGLGWFGIALLVRAAVRRRRRAKPSCGSTSPVASV